MVGETVGTSSLDSSVESSEISLISTGKAYSNNKRVVPFHLGDILKRFLPLNSAENNLEANISTS